MANCSMKANCLLNDRILVEINENSAREEINGEQFCAKHKASIILDVLGAGS